MVKSTRAWKFPIQCAARTQDFHKDLTWSGALFPMHAHRRSRMLEKWVQKWRENRTLRQDNHRSHEEHRNNQRQHPPVPVAYKEKQKFAGNTESSSGGANKTHLFFRPYQQEAQILLTVKLVV
jgi:hypothetical protein